MAQKSAARQFLLDLLLAGVTTAAGLVAFKYIHAHFDPATQKRDAARRLGDEKLRRLGRRVELDEWEEQIATELILPSQIAESFESIGGLENVVSSLHEGVIAPLCYPELFSQMTSAEGGSGAGLLGAPKGVLLYGPPGTGKTMLAKALAKESGATFINMHVSTLTNKWFGESNKLVAALFSLARKLQPSIIFIDEIDAFLRDRGSGDHEATGMMKAEFMTLWDGLTSSSDRILVLGATNRPNDIDAAFLRRMPKRYSVPLPDAVQRLKILRLMLASSRLDPSFKYEPLVARTEGCSGSDLKELCRAAAMQPVREYLRSGKGKAKVLSLKEAQKTRRIESGEVEEREKATVETRPIRNSDFFVVEGSSTVGSAGAKKG